MKPERLNSVFQIIFAEYEKLSWESRPWGIWFKLHDPIPSQTKPCFTLSYLTPLRAAWFYDKDRGLHERSPWEVTRMYRIHFEMGIFANEVFNRGRYEIGLTAFAHYENSDDIYLEIIWAGLNGQGCRLEFTRKDDEPEIMKDHIIWIS